MVSPLGYKVTRASLIERSTYEVDADGGHLAIYLAPTADISTDQFANDFVAAMQRPKSPGQNWISPESSP